MLLYILQEFSGNHSCQRFPVKTTVFFLQCSCGSFTEQGNGSGQIFSLPSTPVQLHQLLHQVTIATPAISNLTCITHTSGRETGRQGGGGENDTTVHTHSYKQTETLISCFSSSPTYTRTAVKQFFFIAIFIACLKGYYFKHWWSMGSASLPPPTVIR